MGKLHLTCFSFSLKGGSPCSSLSDDALHFCSSLSEDLKNLEQSLVHGSVSLRWSTKAMNLLKKMHLEFLKLAGKSKLPISLEGESWLDGYMEETVMLLDICNLSKRAMSGMESYHMMVNFAVRKLQGDSSLETRRLEIERLETERKKLLNVENCGDAMLHKKLSECWKHEKGINPVLFVVKSTTIIVSLFLVSAIVSPVSIDMGGDDGHEFHQLDPFATSLATLIYRFHMRSTRPEGNSTLGLVEMEMVEKAVADLKAQIAEGVVDREKVLASVATLKRSYDDLKEGLENFDCVANELFEEVIKGRKKLLGIYSCSTRT